MSDIDEREIIKRFEAISEFKPAPEIAARDIARVRQKLSEQEVGLGTGQQSMWRIIMKSRITKVAAAAVIIIAVIIGAYNLGGSIDGASVAWGQVVQRVESIPTATYRRTVLGPQGGLGSSVDEEIVYLSGRTVRVDSFGMGGVHPLNCWVSIGEPPLGLRIHEYDANTEAQFGGVLVYLEGEPNKPSSDPGMNVDENLERWARERNVDLEEYQTQDCRSRVFFLDETVIVDSRGRHIISEEEPVKWFRHLDPREWVKEALSLDYKKLGRDSIDGLEVEGVEVAGSNLTVAPLRPNRPNVTIRFWIDIKTGLPVRYEARARYDTLHGDWAMVVDEIHWNVHLDPNIFEPNLPVE